MEVVGWVGWVSLRGVAHKVTDGGGYSRKGRAARAPPAPELTWLLVTVDFSGSPTGPPKVELKFV